MELSLSVIAWGRWAPTAPAWAAGCCSQRWPPCSSGPRSSPAALLRVGFCGYCGGALHQASDDRNGREYRYYRCENIYNKAQRRCGRLGSVQQDVLNDAIAAKLLEVIGKYELTEKRLIEGDDHSATLRKLGMQIADLTTQHYVNNGIPGYHQRMQELEAEHARVSALPREKPKVRTIATGKTFRQHWQEMGDEQRHAYLKSASVSVLVVRKEDYTARKEELAVRTASEHGTQERREVAVVPQLRDRQLDGAGPGVPSRARVVPSPWHDQGRPRAGPLDAGLDPWLLTYRNRKRCPAMPVGQG
jgi:hypothetical protein